MQYSQAETAKKGVGNTEGIGHVRKGLRGWMVVDVPSVMDSAHEQLDSTRHEVSNDVGFDAAINRENSCALAS